VSKLDRLAGSSNLVAGDASLTDGSVSLGLLVSVTVPVTSTVHEVGF
jgi:hypothetical protein